MPEKDVLRRLCERIGGEYEEDPTTGTARCRIRKPVELDIAGDRVKAYLVEGGEGVEFGALIYSGTLPHVVIDVERKDVKILRTDGRSRVGIVLEPGSEIEYLGGGVLRIR